MAYTKNVWADRDVQHPNRYTLTNVSGTTYDIAREEGTVNAAGTLFNAVKMNNIEDGIETLDLGKAPMTSPTFATSITGSYLTPSEMLITDANKKIISAPVATYPSLTELAFIKGVTSSIQTQLNSITGRLDTIEGSMYKIGISIPSNNCDNALSDGCYNYGDTTTNRPTGTNYGTIFVMVSAGLTGNNSNNWVNQIGMSTGDTMHFRQKVNAGAWTAWKTISKS